MVKLLAYDVLVVANEETVWAGPLILVGVMEDVCWYRLYLAKVTAGTVMKVYFDSERPDLGTGSV